MNESPPPSPEQEESDDLKNTTGALDVVMGRVFGLKMIGITRSKPQQPPSATGQQPPPAAQ